MATMTPPDPEVYTFVKSVEKDDRIVSCTVYKHHPSVMEKYLIALRLPENHEVVFKSEKLAEARRYINEMIEAWYKQARGIDLLTNSLDGTRSDLEAQGSGTIGKEQTGHDQD